MVSTMVVLVLLAIAAVTDIRWRKIFNWNCYPGIAIALAMSATATLLGIDTAQGSESQIAWWGIVPIMDALAGTFACGLAMLVCYVFFAGAVGGGDVKLIAMIGAFLGLSLGLEAMLWTFVLGGCQALITLVWRHGVWNVLRKTTSIVWLALKAGGRTALADEERQPLKADLFLSPSALTAVVIVKFGLGDWIGGW